MAIRTLAEIVIGVLYTIGAGRQALCVLRHSQEFYGDMAGRAWLRPAETFIEKGARASSVVIAVLVAASRLESRSPYIRGAWVGPALVAGGVFSIVGALTGSPAAGMAAISGRRILENWASGLFLQILAPFTVGDRIETEGITGWVEEINSREVVLTSQDRRTVRIPNAKVANSILYNYTDDEQRRSQIGFSVGYDQDVNAAKMVATEAVAAVELVHSDPAPVGYIDELGDDGFVCQMRFYHNDSDRIRVRDQVALAIATAMAEAGISMPTPELVILKSRITDAS